MVLLRFCPGNTRESECKTAMYLGILYVFEIILNPLIPEHNSDGLVLSDEMDDLYIYIYIRSP